MKYDFDETISRKNTGSIKWESAVSRGKPSNILPLWVADMDYKTAPAIIEAIKERAEHRIFGYTEPDEDYFTAVSDWFARYFDWNIRKNWILPTPGVVSAIVVAINAFTKSGEAIIIQTPVYPPFSNCVKDAGRTLITNPLELKNGKYSINFGDFENKIIENKVKMFILCSPHNPVGRVWTEEELNLLCEICEKHGVIILSDEIHADFTYTGYNHHVLAKINPQYQDFIITCTAASKTFNLAALQNSNIIISSDTLRAKFLKAYSDLGYSQLNVFGLVACQAAYTSGHEWLRELKEYLQKNLDYLREFLDANIPQIKLIEPEGTYLIWLDFRELKLSDAELNSFVTNKAKLWLNDGPSFGEDGKGFQRMNIACPKSTLKQALEQLSVAVKDI